MEDLDDYREWLHRRGRDRSAAQYVRGVRRYLDDPDGTWEIVFGRAQKEDGGDYSPNYRLALVSCIRSWAKYKGDTKLQDYIQELTLPAPIPAGAREPIAEETWQRVLAELDGADYLIPPVRYACQIVCLRGIRAGDVLRLKRTEIDDALDTGTLSFEAKGQRRLSYSALVIEEPLQALSELTWPVRNPRVRDLVCPNGKPANRQDSAGRVIRLAFDRVAKKLKVDPKLFYAHRFRHTYANDFLQEMAGDPEALQKLREQMGWARLDTALNYLRRDRRKELDEVEQRMIAKKRKRG